MAFTTVAERMVFNRRLAKDAPTEQGVERFAFSHPGPLTLALLGINCVIAGLTLVGAPSDLAVSLRLDAWGAKVNAAIAAGEWWRLLASTFLHGGWGHLLFNGYALFVVGSLVEQSYGRARLLTIYLVSGLAASLASLAFTDAMSIGASGAIFGLFGASFLILRRGRQRVLSVVSSRTLAGLAAWAANSILGGLTSTGIDNAAHLAGLAAGVVVAALLPEGRARTSATLCVIALVWTGAMMERSVTLTTPYEKHFERGMLALTKGDTARFSREMTAAGAYQPALVMLASEHIDAGDAPRALAELDKATASRCVMDFCAGTQIERARALLVLGRPEDVLTATRAVGTNADVHTQRRATILRAIALHRLHRDREVVEITEPAGTWNDRFTAAARSVRAPALAALGRHADAARVYEEIGAATPTDAEPWLRARIEYLMVGLSDDASRALERAVTAAQRAVDSSRGTDAASLRLLGTSLRTQHRCAEAESAFARARALTRSADIPSPATLLRVWSENPPREDGIAIRAQNMSGRRLRLMLELRECKNVRERCDVPLDPCIDLRPGRMGEVWIYQLDAFAEDSFTYQETWNAVR